MTTTLTLKMGLKHGWENLIAINKLSIQGLFIPAVVAAGFLRIDPGTG
jgi:hypothetical protein